MSGSGLAAPFAFLGGSYPGTGGNCSTTLAPGSSCTIVVRYAPTSTGLQSSTVSIAYFDGANSQSSTRSLAGTGAAPALLTISNSPIFNYGAVANGSVNDRSFTINNSGGVAANGLSGSGLTAPFSFKGGTYPGTGGTCGATLASSGSCTVVVTFNPTASGAHASSFTLSYNDGAVGQSVSRDVAGSSSAPATLTISDGPTFSFGAVANGSSNEKSFTVINSGSFSATAMAGSGLVGAYSFKDGTYPGTGGTCGLTLAPAATCTMLVVFAPTTSSTHNASLSLSYDNGATTTSSTRAITGSSTGPAQLTISGGPTYDFLTRATGSATEATLTVSNTGGFPAAAMSGTGLSAPFSFKGGSYPGAGGTCGSSLSASGTCSLVIVYAPTATGTQSGTISLSYNDGAATQSATRAVQGTGAAPALLSISDAVVFDYGSVANGSTNDKSFTISNSGGVTATAISGGGLSVPFSFKGGTFPGAGGTCGATLPAGNSCTIFVTFNPSTSASHSSSINVSYNDGAASQSASRGVQGTSSAPATLAISDGPTFDFGAVANGSSTDRTFTITNTGNFSATSMAGSGLTAPYTFKGGSYPGAGGTCGLSLASSGTCTVIVTFNPTATATHNGSMDITFNNGVTNVTSSRALSGTSSPPAVLVVSDGPGAFDFGTRATGSTNEKIFSVSNTGGFTASSILASGLSAPFTFKGGSYPGTGGTCGAILNASSSCTLVIVYAPTATGAQSATLSMGFNNGVSTQAATRAVQGTGAAPASLALSDGPGNYSFGSRATGSATDRVFTLNNSGGVTATGLSGGGLSAPYGFKGGTFPGAGGTCGASLNASASCTIVVTFAPTVLGATSSSLDVSYSDGAASQVASRGVQGAGVAPAFLSISDGPGAFDFGAVVATGSIDKVFTIQNTGSLQATAIAGAGLSAPFSFKGGSFPGSGGTCGSTLNASASCTVVVAFNPSVTGTFSGTLNVGFDDGATTQTASRGVQGTGAAPASIAISGGPTFDFNSRANGSTTDAVLTLTNGGGVTATSMTGTGLSAPFTFKGGSYPGTTGTCGTTLAAAANCTIVVSYSPTTNATHNGTVTIGFNDGLAAQSATRALQGTGVPPAALLVSDGPGAYDFGTRATGSTSERIFTITNNGSFTASALSGSGLSAPFAFKGGTFPGTGGTCSTNLNASSSCSIVVTYSPTGTGAQTRTLAIGYFDGANNQSSTRDVTGTGAAPALLGISDPTTFDFGSVANGSVSEKTFTVSNSGGVPATSLGGGGLSTPFAFKGGTYPGAGGTCASSLGTGASCTVVVTFSPSASASHTSTLEISYNDGAASQLTSRGVVGTSSAPATLAISDGATFDFGAVANGSTNEKVFTIQNTGNFSATAMSGGTLSAPYSFKGGSYPGFGGTCGASLAPAATCTVVVIFAPAATNTHNASLAINFQNGVTSTSSTRAMTGTSSAPAVLAISDGPGVFDFGTRATGSTSEKIFTVFNTGGFGASALGASGLAAPFTFKGGSYPGAGGTCGATLVASNTCTLVVVYAPTATGAQSVTMSLAYNNGVSTQSATRDLQGTGATPATISISDGPGAFDFGSRAIGSATDKSFTLNNSGGVAATGVSGGGISAPFTFKGGSYPGTGGTCASTLNAASSCTVVVTYAPSISGAQSGTMSFSFNDGVTTQSSTRNVQGTGVTPAILLVSDGPGAFDFGPVAATGSVDKVFTVQNTGSLQATAIAGTGLSAPFTFKGGTFPGTGGTCGLTLNPASSCSVVVTFNPAVTGTFSSTLNIGFNDGANNQTSSRAVQGTGATAASLSISGGPTLNFNSRPTGSTIDATLTVSNAGGVTATSINGTGLSAPFSFKDGSYPGTGGTCGATLAAAANCTIIVSYSPTTAAVHNGTVTVNFNDGLAGQSSNRALAGTGVAPALLSVSDGPTFDFGTRATGSAIDYVFTVSNGGSWAASSLGGSGLSAPFAFKGGTFPGVGGSCTGTLNPGFSCTLVVTFSPTATGSQSRTITLGYFDGASSTSATRGVIGSGATPALLTISDPVTFDFGSVANGSSSDKSFSITNSGGVAATGLSGAGLTSPFSFKGGSFPGTGGTCGTSLAAGGSCWVVVTFNPTTTGSHSSSVDVTYVDGAGSQIASRGVTGTSSAPATLAISDGPTFDFGSVANGSNNEKSFNVQNTGNFSATSMAGGTLSTPYSYKGGTYPGFGGTCGLSLAPSSSCTIVVTFAPTVSATHNDALTINFQNGVTSTSSSRALTGASSAPALLAISDGPAAFDFGTRATGSTTEKVFTITNNGGFTASSLSATGLSAPFAYKGGSYPGTGGTCATSLGATNSCSIVVVYAPTGTGTQSVTFSMGYGNGVSAQSATRDISGTGAAPATLAISDGPTYDFGNRATSSSTDRTFTVTNNGGVTASSLSGGGLDAPFGFKGGSFPGTGGTCSTSLNASASCSIVVTYSPTTAGLHSDGIEISFSNGIATVMESRSVQGTGVVPANLLISDGPSFSFGAVAVGGSLDKTFNVSNSGTVSATSVAPAVALAAPFSFKGGSYPGTGGTCGASLTAGGTCSIVVTFSPSATGSQTSSLSLTYNDGAATQTSTRPMDGVGAAPAAIAVSDGPGTFNFGNRANGSNTDKTFTLSNSGGVTASSIGITSLAAPYAFKGGSFPGAGGTCATSLASGASCMVVVTYSPTALGVTSGSLDVSYFDGATTPTSSRALQGTSVSPALLAISNGPSYDYGSRVTGTSLDMTFTVTNNGSFTATAIVAAGPSAPFVFKGGPFPGTGGTCTSSLVPAGTCTIVVTWSPTATGAQAGTIRLDYNDGSQAQQASRDVQGTGVSPALLTISDPTTFNFGTVANGGVSEKTFTINNSGGATATSLSGSALVAPFSFKGGSYPGAGGSCSSTLTASTSCTIVVTFSPLSTNTFSGQIDVTYNDGANGQTASRPIQAASAAPANLTVSDGPGTFNFGTIVVGQTADKTFTISNSGGVTGTTLNGAALAAPFSYKGGAFPGSGGNCGVTLGASASCTVVVTYAPIAGTTSTETLSINFNSGVGSQSATRSLQGSAGTAASLAISNGATFNFGTVANGAVVEQGFTVSNSGDAAATSIASTGLSAPFSFKGGSFPGSGGSCTTTLAGSANCTIVVVYSPTSVASSNGTITLNYIDGVTTQSATRPVQGTAVAPASLTISDGPSYDFGTVAQGAVVERAFTITNSGSFSASSLAGAGLSVPFTFKGGSYPGTGGNCGTSLASSASCTVVVQYSPTSIGVQGSMLSMNYNDGASNQSSSRSLTAVAVTPATLSISDGPGSYNFGTLAVGGTLERTFTVTNSGGFTATSMTGGGVSGAYSYKGGSFPGTGGSCSTTLSGSASCTVVVVFAPSVTGVQTSNIDIGFNDGITVTSAVRGLTGTAVNQATLSISGGPGTFEYGNATTGTQIDQVFTISNTGGVSATSMSHSGLSGAFGFTGGSYPGSGGTCGLSLGAGGSCTVSISFAPTTVGIQASTFTIGFNTSVTTSSASRALQGTALAPSAPIAPVVQVPAASPSNVSSLTVRVGGVAPNDVVRLYTDASCSGSALATGTATASNLDLAVNLLVDGPYNFRATRQNSAGTVSACSSASATFTLDTVAPILTSFVNQTPGRSPHWTAQPVIRATGTFNSSDFLRVYTDASCSTQLTQFNVPSSSTTADVTIPTIATQAAYTYYVRAFDLAGNSTSCPGAPVNYVYDFTNVTVGFTQYFTVTTEGLGTINVGFTLSTARPYPITLNYRALGTALAGTHVSGVAMNSTGTVVIPANQTTANLSFTVPENANVESDKFVDFALIDTNYEFARAAGQIYHRVLIRDNDQTAAVPIALPGGVGAGYFGACFVGNDKKLRCMGRGAIGLPGDGTLVDKSTYVVIDSGNNYVKVVTGHEHNCALTDSGGADPAGTVKCWGRNNNGQLGDGTTTNRISPTTVSALGSGNKEITAGAYFTCAINSSDHLRCWGLGNSRQVLPTSTTGNNPNPVVTDGTNTYASVVASGNYACAIRIGGALYCWGNQSNGQLGNGTNNGSSVTSIQLIDSAVSYSQIVVGESHTCGLTTLKKIKCWGANGNGQLGDNTRTTRATPTAVDAAVNYSQISAGGWTTCGIVDGTGALRCTGRGDYGQLLDRLATDDNLVFSDIQSGTTFSRVSVGYQQTWAATTTGFVISGGWNMYFATSGNGQPLATAYAPSAFDSATSFAQLDKGWSERSTCAISDDKIRCSGHGDTTGFWGLGISPDMAGYMWLDPLNDYTDVQTGRFHMCAIRKTTGKLFCAGNTANSGAGAGSTNQLRAVDSALNFTALSVGHQHTCAITDAGALRCWGANGNGRLGDGTGTARTAPVAIDSANTYSKISASWAHTCAIRTNNDLYCWGAQSNGRLGDGQTGGTNQTTPVLIDSGTKYREISTGGAHTCGITNYTGATGGTLKCWGGNGNGQLGNGTTTQTGTPITIDSSNNYLKVAASDTNTCAVRADGRLLCWGNWQWGIAGGILTNGLTPVEIDASFDYVDVAAGRYRICGLTTTNQIRCLGHAWYNNWGDSLRTWIPEALPAPGFIQN